MIQVEQLSKAFGKFRLFDGFSMEIADGEFVIIEGASGCGKTTLLNILGSLEKFDSGRVIVDGIDISQKKNQRKYLQEKVGFLFQNFALVERMTIEENLKLVKNNCRSGVSIYEALNAVGLREKKNQKVYSLSGGEQQRVALARLMIKKCDYVFADEPTGSLDRKNADAVFSILEKINESGKTVIMVTHDEAYQQKGKRVIRL